MFNISLREEDYNLVVTKYLLALLAPGSVSHTVRRHSILLPCTENHKTETKLKLFSSVFLALFYFGSFLKN